LNLEFREASGGLPQNLFETVCAFLNREGGTVLLGVTDDGTPCAEYPRTPLSRCRRISLRSLN
jgi:predicted HTH transcriptional regulator